MCGRFYVDIEMEQELRQLLGKYGRQIHVPAVGDVRPSDQALILKGDGPEREMKWAGVKDVGNAGTGLEIEVMKWGFLPYTGQNLLINARAETAAEKPMFRNSLLQRRCVIPARCFFEWNKEKEKVTFKNEGSRLMYMAGFYQMYEEGNRFVILTTAANDSMRPVHDRMPVMLKEEELEAWIQDEQYMRMVLQRVPEELFQEQEYEQQTLEFI